MKKEFINWEDKVLLPLSFIMICFSLFRDYVNMMPYILLLSIRIVLLLCSLLLVIVSLVNMKYKVYEKVQIGKYKKRNARFNIQRLISACFIWYFCIYLIFQLDILSEIFSYIMILIYGIQVGYRIALHSFGLSQKKEIAS